MGQADFVNQLRELGYTVEELGDNKIAFPYEIPVGRFKGQKIKLGFHAPTDFPVSPPSGPHLTPHLLPMNAGASAHPARVADSNFGPEWQYWSRPFHKWAETNKTAKDYMRYIRHLFETQ